ncbi:MAG: lamin tail domain-containing protein [Limisphaerales bacterium]
MGVSGDAAGSLGGNSGGGPGGGGGQGGGGPGGGGGSSGGTATQTIYGGEAGAPIVFDGTNWWMDTFFKCFRDEYNQRLWELNNSFFDPTNLAAQGLTVASSFAKSRQTYVNSALSSLGTYYKPNRPANVFPPSGGIIAGTTNLVTSPYSHPQGTPQLATKWEIRIASGSYEVPVLRVTTTNTCLTNYPIPSGQLAYGQTYYWRATHIDTNGHPSVISAETAFSWGTTNLSAGALVMNEILVDNHGTIQNAGTYPAYIELFNNSSSNIVLSGYSLTDDPAELEKHSFPSNTASPGSCNWVLTNAVINELLANAASPLEQAVEIHNLGSSPQDIGGWWLSDDPNNRKKYQIPSGTVLPAGGFKVFYAVDLASGAVPFSFRAAGGGAVLSAVDGSGNLNGAASIVNFGASAEEVSFGRVPGTGLNCTMGGAEFWPLAAHTFGQDSATNVATFRTGAGGPNAAPSIGPITINEIMYHPCDLTNVVNGVTNVLDDSFDEFIELVNISTNVVDLGGWVLTGDTQFAFPDGTLLAPGGYLLLVSFDPSVTTNLAAFCADYAILSNTVAIYGPYSDNLPNTAALLELAYPLLIDGATNYVNVDKVEYGSHAPWPGKANGKGHSLSRLSSGVIGNTAANWSSKKPTPGAVNHGVVLSPVISTTSPLAGGVVNVGYTNTFTATNGLAPYTWRILVGTVPGLSLAPSGVLSGTPTAAGTFSFTVQLTDGMGAVVSKTVTIQIVNPVPTIASVGCVGGTFRLQIRGEAGVAYTVECSSNLVDWKSVFTTNSAVMPFEWTAGTATNSAMFYRVLPEP